VLVRSHYLACGPQKNTQKNTSGGTVSRPAFMAKLEHLYSLRSFRTGSIFVEIIKKFYALEFIDLRINNRRYLTANTLPLCHGFLTQRVAM